MMKPPINLRAEIIWAVVAAVLMGLFFWVATPATVVSSKDKVVIWQDIEQASRKAGLDPHFVYAICMAESSLDPNANSGYARGLMQLSKVAWKEVSNRPYGQAYNPKANVEVGVAYFVHLKQFLEQHNAFSYANLAASYRYGPYALKNVNFNASRLKPPTNHIYKELFAGNTSPVPIPVLK